MGVHVGVCIGIGTVVHMGLNQNTSATEGGGARIATRGWGGVLKYKHCNTIIY